MMLQCPPPPQQRCTSPPQSSLPWILPLSTSSQTHPFKSTATSLPFPLPLFLLFPPLPLLLLPSPSLGACFRTAFWPMKLRRTRHPSNTPSTTSFLTPPTLLWSVVRPVLRRVLRVECCMLRVGCCMLHCYLQKHFFYSSATPAIYTRLP